MVTFNNSSAGAGSGGRMQRTSRIISSGGPRTQRGFTLLELLVVVSILVAVAGIATFNLRGVSQDEAIKVAQVEMRQIANAVQRFYTDTGYYPGEGPFALLDATCANSNGAINASVFDSVPSADRQDWFEAPLNFTQLLQRPEFCTGHALEKLVDANNYVNTGRGWNGPYIRSHEGFVDVTSDLDRLDGSGDLSSTPDLLDIPSLSDPFDSAGGDYTWSSNTNGDLSHSVGAPYMLFIVELDDQLIPRLVSAGPDAVYDGVNGSASIEGWCAPADDSDDLVLCF